MNPRCSVTIFQVSVQLQNYYQYKSTLIENDLRGVTQGCPFPTIIICAQAPHSKAQD